MRAAAPAELLTGVLALYLSANLPWNSPSSVLVALQYVLCGVAGLCLAWGAWQRSAWSVKGAVVLAAVSGVANLTTVAAVMKLYEQTPGPATVLAFAMVGVINLCQLYALVLALVRLQLRPGAA